MRDHPHASQAPDTHKDSRDVGPNQVLVIDDHLVLREVLTYLLTSAGVKEVVEAASCAEARQKLQQTSPDVVILDLALPDGHGLQLLEEFSQQFQSTPIVIHSCQCEHHVLRRSYKSGAAAFVVKGDDKNALLRVVRRAAQGRHSWTEEQLQRISQA